MNEPYERVASNNKEVTSSLTGAAIGLGVSGSGMLGARMHYNGIDGRVGKQVNKAQRQLTKQQRVYDQALANFQQLGTSSEPRTNAKSYAKAKQRYMKADDRLYDLEQASKKVTAPGYADGLKNNHAYSKMGGWKKTAAVGGSALLGGAIGYGTSQVN